VFSYRYIVLPKVKNRSQYGNQFRWVDALAGICTNDSVMSSKVWGLLEGASAGAAEVGIIVAII